MFYTPQVQTTTGGGIAGIIATIASVVVTVVEVVRNVIKHIREHKQKTQMRPPLPHNGNVIDMTYNDSSGRWNVRMPITHVNPNYINGGMHNMYEYDVTQGINYIDTPETSSIYNRNLPYGYGYDPNKRDYIWQDKTLGQVPSTTEYVPFEARTGFDPTDWLKRMNSYVSTMEPYYPYRNKNLFIKYTDVEPPKDDSYLKDPFAGIQFKNLQNHFERRQFNPYEPSRPFATYDTNSINANDPAVNPYEMTQEQINGMVNRSNYYKDYILNINRMNPFGAPNDIDNPYNLLGGPSYVGADGQLHIRQVPPQPEYHARREFLNSGREKPYPTIGGEAFGRSMYHGFDFYTMNQPNMVYNNIPNSGPTNMYDTATPNDPIAPPLMSIPFIRNYIQKQKNEEARQKIGNPDPYAAAFSQPTQKPVLQDPNNYANPYSMSIQNQIDRSKLMIDPKCGMVLNNGDPNDPLAMLLSIQPAGQPITPQQEMRNQVALQQLYNMQMGYPQSQQPNPYNFGSVLGGPTHVGLMRQGVAPMMYGYQNNQQSQYNQYGMYNQHANTYGMPQQNPQQQMYQQQPQMAHYGQQTNSVFTDEATIRSMANYGMSPNQVNQYNNSYGMPQPQQNPQQQSQQQPQVNTRSMINPQSLGYPQQQTSVNDIFGDKSDNSNRVVGNPLPEARDVEEGLTQDEILDIMLKADRGELDTTPVEFKEPERPKSPDQLAAKLFNLS